MYKSKLHNTEEGLNKLIALKNNLNLGLTPELTKAFPGIAHIPRPIIQVSDIPGPMWMAGFTTGEGCFAAYIERAPTAALKYTVRDFILLLLNILVMKRW